MSPKRLRICSWISGRLWPAELGGDRARLDQRDPHVALGDLLAQRLAERADAVLGQVVDARAESRRAAGDGADVDHVGDLARRVLGGASRWGRAAWAQYEQAAHVDVEHPLPLLERRVQRSGRAASRRRC